MAQVIPGFGLERPSREDGVAALEEVVGGRLEAERIWRAACESAGVPIQQEGLTDRQFVRVAEALAQQRGLIGIVGNSLWVRVQAYELLALRHTMGAAR